MKLNTKTKLTKVKTITYAKELERAVATCMLWENSFYESGNDAASRISELVAKASPEDVAELAIRARFEYKLRHVPLFLVSELVKRADARNREDGLVSTTLAQVINRPDELGEFLSIYWRDKKCPIAKQVKLGLQKAFAKFTEYQFSKWDRDGAIKLRDVMFLVHPNPGNMGGSTKQARKIYKAIADQQLKPADTWEVEISAKGNNKATWTRLINEGKLGYMALLQNLRNMADAGVDSKLINSAIGLSGKKWALPFRYLTAARIEPQFADALNDAMLSSIRVNEAARAKTLDGQTVVVVDVSGSMTNPVSGKGQTSRLDAACGVAVLVRELGSSVRVFSFSDRLCEVPNYRGIALADKIKTSQPNSGTATYNAMTGVKRLCPDADRVILITDEQQTDIGRIPHWAEHSYVINVASYKTGIDCSDEWTKINGWSERVIDWILVDEKLD